MDNIDEGRLAGYAGTGLVRIYCEEEYPAYPKAIVLSADDILVDYPCRLGMSVVLTVRHFRYPMTGVSDVFRKFPVPAAGSDLAAAASVSLWSFFSSSWLLSLTLLTVSIMALSCGPWPAFLKCLFQEIFRCCPGFPVAVSPARTPCFVKKGPGMVVHLGAGFSRKSRPLSGFPSA